MNCMIRFLAPVAPIDELVAWKGPQAQRPSAHRVQTTPIAVPDASSHPRSLLPGRAPSVSVSGRPDLFFAQSRPVVPPTSLVGLYPPHLAPHAPCSPLPAPVPAPPSRPLSTHHPSLFFEQSLPPQRPPPPLPSKTPPVAQLTPPATVAIPNESGVLPSSPPAVPVPLPEEVHVYDQPKNGAEEDFAEAIALSQAASELELKLRDEITSQEEEDLARALEASLLDTENRAVSPRNAFSEPTSPKGEASNLRMIAEYPVEMAGGICSVPSGECGIRSPPPSDPKPVPSLSALEPTITPFDDEAYARQLAAEEESSEANEGPIPRESLPEPIISVPSPPATQVYRLKRPLSQSTKESVAGSSSFTAPSGPRPKRESKILDDEAFARQLAEEEERSFTASQSRREPSASSSVITEDSELPRYVSHSRTRENGQTTELAHHFAPTRAQTASASLPSARCNTRLSAGYPPSYSVLEDATLPMQDSRPNAIPLEPSQSKLASSEPLGGTILSAPVRNLQRAQSFDSVMEGFAMGPQISLEPTSQGLVNINSFVNKELFVGVTVGFSPPTITDQLIPMSTPMPNIISLPYGRAAPLHLQGPSWRHLLKLMAKLSGTRLEPTVSALAACKNNLKLRTVIQFIKPHPQCPDWRTILYFSIDHPPPQPAHHQNVNELPYSYGLFPVPSCLDQASDTPVSKTYTIPASESVPYPILPVTFPSLATYLQAALEESRRYLNDSSSHYRKLARMVQMCYKSEDDTERPAERRSMSELFKKVIRRSNKTNGRGANEETYELVTPFVADEWG